MLTHVLVLFVDISAMELDAVKNIMKSNKAFQRQLAGINNYEYTTYILRHMYETILHFISRPDQNAAQ